jgi:hypothetical protein
MYYLRDVRNHSKFTQAGFDLDAVAKAMTDRDGGLISVYAISTVEEADRIAVLHSMNGRDRPDQIDYVLIPEEWLIEAGVTAVPDTTGLSHPALQSSHCELHGLTPGATCEELCKKFRDNPSVTKRLQKKNVIDLAKAELAEEPEAARKLLDNKPKWIEKL